MAIQTACPHCDKPYRASDQMAGRRVRCRGCGGVFTLGGHISAAAKPVGPPAAALPNGVNAAGPTGELDPATADAFRIHGAPPPGGGGPQARLPHANGPDTPLNPLDAPDLAAAGDSDAVFDKAFQDYRPAFRRNYIHNFPYAYLIDRWLPPVLSIVAAVWLVLQFSLGNESKVAWAIPVRLLIALAQFVLIVFPLGWLGMSLGCQWARFLRPPDAARRVAAATLFPYVLLLVIWHLVGDMSDAIPGLLVSLLVASGLAWLMYRPAPEESAISVSAAGLAFVIAMLACAVATIGINEAARAIARSSKPSADLASSPIGPGLRWDAVMPPAEPVALAPVRPATSEDDAEPKTRPAVPATLPVVKFPGTTLPVTPPATRPTVSPLPSPPATEEPDPIDTNPVFGQSPQTRPAVASRPAGKPLVVPSRPPDPATRPTAPAVAATGDPIADKIVAAASPLVAGVVAPREIGPFERAVFPLTASNHVLLVRPASGTDSDALEVWDLAALKVTASRRPVPRDDTDDQVSGNYALSASGTRIARITTFPTLGVDIVSLDAAPAPRRIAFDTTYGQPRVVGFASDDHLLVRWDLDGKAGIQVLDLKKSTIGKGIDVPSNPWHPLNRAMSADGRFYALVGSSTAANGEERTELAIIDVRANTIRRIPITGIGPQWAPHPTGVAFSQDGRRIGILYERGDEAVILGTTVAGGKDFDAIIIPAGHIVPHPQGLAPSTGRLASMAGGRAWLVGGNAVVDTESRRLMGELNVPPVLGQRPFADSVALIRDDEGPRRLLVLRLATSLVNAAPTTRPAGSGKTD